MKADPIAPCFQKVFTKSLWLKSRGAAQGPMHRHLPGTAFPMPSNPSTGVSTCSKTATSLQSPSPHPSICPPFSYFTLLEARKYSTFHSNFSRSMISSSFLPSGLLKAAPSDQPPFSDRAQPIKSPKHACPTSKPCWAQVSAFIYYSHYSKSFKWIISLLWHSALLCNFCSKSMGFVSLPILDSLYTSLVFVFLGKLTDSLH